MLDRWPHAFAIRLPRSTPLTERHRQMLLRTGPIKALVIGALMVDGRRSLWQI